MKCLLPAILIIAAILSARAQEPTFSVTTKEVIINTLVTDHNKPVTDLKAEDFAIFDNGVKQKIEFVRFEQLPISATMALDLSKSVSGDLLKNLKSAGVNLLYGLKEGERAGLITFNNSVTLRSPLISEIWKVKDMLDSLQPLPYGDTALIDASYAGLMLAESESERPLLIIFSDGLDTISWLSEEDVLESAKKAHAVVYAVSTKLRRPERSRKDFPESEETVAYSFLGRLIKYTGGSLFVIESEKNFGDAFQKILEEFRKRYLITYIPKGVADSGWHEVKVQVKKHHYNINHRIGYLLESPGKR